MCNVPPDFMRLYDDHVHSEPQLDKRVYYTSSRPKFLAILHALQSESFGSLIEVGPSEFSSLLQAAHPEKKISVVGLDRSSLNWGLAHEVPFSFLDLLAPPPVIDVEPADVVLCSEVLEHLQGNPRIACSTLRRLVRPGGRVIVTTPNIARLFNRLKLLLGFTPLERVGPLDWAGHFREYTLREVVDFLRAADLEVERAEHALYWDSLPIYLMGGERGCDERGHFFWRPRYGGWKRIAALPVLKAVETTVRCIPPLRNGMIFIARRPR